VEPDSTPDQPQPAADPEYEQARLTLDAQARAWSAGARRVMWFTGLAILAAVAVSAGFVLF
jgi:hypothetical protein